MYVNHLAKCLKQTQYTVGVMSKLLLLEWALKASPMIKYIYAPKILWNKVSCNQGDMNAKCSLYEEFLFINSFV